MHEPDEECPCCSSPVSFPSIVSDLAQSTIYNPIYSTIRFYCTIPPSPPSYCQRETEETVSCMPQGPDRICFRCVRHEQKIPSDVHEGEHRRNSVQRKKFKMLAANHTSANNACKKATRFHSKSHLSKKTLHARGLSTCCNARNRHVLVNSILVATKLFIFVANYFYPSRSKCSQK